MHRAAFCFLIKIEKKDSKNVTDERAKSIFITTHTVPEDEPPYLKRISDRITDKIDTAKTFRDGIRLTEKRIFFPRRRKDKRKLYPSIITITTA